MATNPPIPAPATPARQAPPSRAIWIALALAAVLVLAGGALFWRASQSAGTEGASAGTLHRVKVTANNCDPGSFAVPAGPTTFEIENASDRPIEWEILDGVMVVEERENIAPGFRSQLTADLRPGRFTITCGLLSNPRGTLEVTASAASDAARSAPPVTAFIGPLSEYKVYLATQSAELATEVGALDEAIRAGNLSAAQAAWGRARLPWKRIEAVTGRMADLDAAIDPLPEYLAGREADPGFTGFHRIEAGLWGRAGLAGLEPVSARLVTDVATLKDRLRTLKLTPADLALGAAQQADRLAEGQIATGEDRWAPGDLGEIEAGLDGIDKTARLMQPLAAAADPAVATRLTEAVTAARAELVGLKVQGAYPPFAAVGNDARARLKAAFAAVSTAMRGVNPALGLT